MQATMKVALTRAVCLLCAGCAGGVKGVEGKAQMTYMTSGSALFGRFADLESTRPLAVASRAAVRIVFDDPEIAARAKKVVSSDEAVFRVELLPVASAPDSDGSAGTSGPSGGQQRSGLTVASGTLAVGIPRVIGVKAGHAELRVLDGDDQLLERFVIGVRDAETVEVRDLGCVKGESADLDCIFDMQARDSDGQPLIAPGNWTVKALSADTVVGTGTEAPYLLVFALPFVPQADTSNVTRASHGKAFGTGAALELEGCLEAICAKGSLTLPAAP